MKLSRLFALKRGLADRFAFYAGAAIVFALIMLSTLSYFSFARSLDDLSRSRLQVTAGELRVGIEQNLGLGLALSDLPGMKEALKLTLAKNRDLQSIAIYEINVPEPVFSAGTVKGVAMADFNEAKHENGGYHGSDDTQLWSALPLHNSFGLVIGYLITSVPTTSLALALERVEIQLMFYLVGFTIAIIPILLLGSRLIFASLSERLESIAQGKGENADRPLEKHASEFLIVKEFLEMELQQFETNAQTNEKSTQVEPA